MNNLITEHLVLAAQYSSRLIALTSESTSEDIKSAHDATKEELEDQTSDSTLPNLLKQATPRLFGLPPDLRIEIYKYCLTKQSELIVSKELKEPALLSTCRRIRQEAIGVWYNLNNFYIHVVNCDATLLVAFDKWMCKDIRKSKDIMKFILTLRGKNWDNLMVWCRSIWAGEVFALNLYDDFYDEETVMYAAHRITYKSRSPTWEVCERQLMALRVVAGQSNKRWLK